MVKIWEVWSISCCNINIWLSCQLMIITFFDIQAKLQELSSCADEDTFQNVPNEFTESLYKRITAPFLHLSANKDTIIRNIIHHFCISSFLEEMSVEKVMQLLMWV